MDSVDISADTSADISGIGRLSVNHRSTVDRYIGRQSTDKCVDQYSLKPSILDQYMTDTWPIHDRYFLMKGLCYKYMSYLSTRSFTLASFSSIFNLMSVPVNFPEIDVVWELGICVHLQYINVMRYTTHDVYCVGDLLHPFQRSGYIWFYYLCFGSLFHWTMNGILTFFRRRCHYSLKKSVTDCR